MIGQLGVFQVLLLGGAGTPCSGGSRRSRALEAVLRVKDVVF